MMRLVFQAELLQRARLPLAAIRSVNHNVHEYVDADV